MPHTLHNRLQQLTQGIPPLIALLLEEHLATKPASDKWSKKEILGHLVDSAINNYLRFVRIQLEPSPFVLQPYVQDKWVQLHNYQEWPTGTLLQAWGLQQQQIVLLMQQTSEEVLRRQCKLGDGSLRTFEWLYKDYVDHLEHHLRQIITYDL